jgi:hypothetical protein
MMAARQRTELFGPSARGPALLETTPANAALGSAGYCGTFEVRDGQAIHQMEFGVLVSMRGREEPRSVLLDGDRLILGTPVGRHLEWQRVHAEGEPQ